MGQHVLEYCRHRPNGCYHVYKIGDSMAAHLTECKLSEPLRRSARVRVPRATYSPPPPRTVTNHRAAASSSSLATPSDIRQQPNRRQPNLPQPNQRQQSRRLSTPTAPLAPSVADGLSTSVLSASRTWRRVPQRLHDRFRAIVRPIFQAYLVGSSGVRDAPACDALVLALLRIPKTVLSRSSRRGRRGFRHLDRHLSTILADPNFVSTLLSVSTPSTDPSTAAVATLASTASPSASVDLSPSPSVQPMSICTPSPETSVPASSASSSASTTFVRPSPASSSASEASDYSSPVSSPSPAPLSASPASSPPDPSPPVTDSIERKIRHAICYFDAGHPAQAIRALQRDGIHPASPEIIENLRAMHPPGSPSDAQVPLPNVPQSLALPDPDLLAKIVSKHARAKSPGLSGWTAEMLLPLLRDPDCAKGLAALMLDIANGLFTSPHVRDALLRGHLLPARKKVTKIRPIAISEVFYRITASWLIHLTRQKAAEIFEPIQFGVGTPGGSASALHAISSLLAACPDNPCILTVDVVNAFNTRSRAAILRKLYAHPQLSLLWRLTHWHYSTPTNLHVLDESGLSVATIVSACGVKQGDPLASLLYALSMHDIYKTVDGAAANVSVVAVADDLNLVGSVSHVPVGFQSLQSVIEGDPTGGVSLAPPKSVFYWPNSTGPSSSVTRWADTHSLTIERSGLLLLGSMISHVPATLASFLSAKVDQHDSLFEALRHPAMPLRIATSLLRLCLLPAMQYQARLHPPDVTHDALHRFHQKILSTLDHILGRPLDPPDPAPSVLPSAVSSLPPRSLDLPLKDGGLGLRHPDLVAPIAYWSSVTVAAPYILSLCPTVPANSPFSSSLPRTFARIADLLDDALTDTDTPWPSEFFPTRQDFSVPAFWRKYLQGTRGLQHYLTSLVEGCRRKKLPALLDDLSRARLLSISSPSASYWLSALDVPSNLVLNNVEFRIALRLRLGLPLTKRSISPVCLCTKSVDRGYHFLSCTKFEKTSRHNLLAFTVQSICRDSGLPFAREEVFTDPARPGRRPRFDGVVHTPGDDFHPACLDFSVAHPLAASHLVRARNSSLAAARTAFDKKRKDYASWTAHQRELHSCEVLVPFIMETFGAIHPTARTFLRDVATLKHTLSNSE